MKRMAGAKPISKKEFAASMAALGPFERPPALAVAVSGGADSMALTLLAADWAAARRGSIVALTVDHRLRNESRAEAKQVAAWLAARGIEHKILAWTGEKPSSDVQAAAREKRYELLEDWCRRQGILHLLVAHNLDDQAETFLLRLGRGSGLYGLSGMASVEFRRGLRVLRPLLSISHRRLVATLDARDQEWLEDPSNANERFRRVRARHVLAGLAPDGLEAARIADAAERLRRAREAIEAEVTKTLVRAVTIRPEGYARLDRAALTKPPEEISLRALARVLTTVSGAVYPPRFERLRQLHVALTASPFRARTLHGCRIAPATGAFRQSRLDIVISREASAIGEDVTLAPGRSALWDERFRVELARGARKDLLVTALGTRGWTEVRRYVDSSAVEAVPASVRVTLPALCDADGIVAAPHLGFWRAGEKVGAFFAVFSPRVGLSA